MAFTDLGSLGSTGATTNNQATLALTTTAAIAIGNLVVVCAAVDNPQNAGDSGVASVTDIGGNTYTKAVQICNAVAAQGGASVSIWYTQATAAVAATANAITATFSNAGFSDATALTARKFSVGAGQSVALEGTPTTLLHNTALDPGALDLTTANIECLRIRACAIELGTTTNWTPTASWTVFAAGQSTTTGTTAEMAVRAEFRIFTGTTASSNPTQSSAINANAYVAFKEVLPTLTGTLTVTEAVDVAAMTGDVVVSGTLTVTGGPDVAAITGGIVLATARVAVSWVELQFIQAEIITAILTATEGADTASLTGQVRWDAVLTVTEAADTAAFNGTVFAGISGTLTTTEAPDVASIAGTVAGTVATLATTEAPDLASITGAVLIPLTGTLTVTEAPDVASIFAGSSVSGTLTTTEASDTAALTGSVRWVAVLAATEAPDVAAVTGSVRWVATLAATEAPDVASFTVLGSAFGILAATEGADIAKFRSARVNQIKDITGTQTPVPALIARQSETPNLIAR